MDSSCRNKEGFDILKHSSLLGLAVLCLIYGIKPFIPALIKFVSFMIGGKKEAAIELLDSDIILKLGVNVFFTAILFTIPFIIVAKLLRYNIPELISFKSKKGAGFISIVLITLGFFAIGDILTMITNLIFMAFSYVPKAPDFGTPSNIGELLFMLLTGAAAPALLEEFAFRGIVLNALRKFGAWPAIIISSLLFALMHGNFVQIPFAFVAGIGLGICYVKTNSLWACILAHFINNMISFSLGSLNASPVVLGLASILIIVLMLFAGAIGLTLYLCKHKHVFKLASVPSCFSSLQITLLMIVSPVMVFAIYSFVKEAVVAISKVS